jgi:hypothetical protein
VLVALAVILAIRAPATKAAADTTAIELGGNPLTVYVGPRGQCQSSYLVNGAQEGSAFPGGEPYRFSPVGDCGFFLAFPKGGAGQPPLLEGKTFGFDGQAPALDLSALYTPGVQLPVTGDGTPANPFTQLTTFAVIDSGAKEDASITETTSYVSGAAQFTSRYVVKNTSGGRLYFRAIYGEDLFAGGEDGGVGVFADGPQRFIGGLSASAGVLGGLQELPAPALAWSSFEELAYPDIWNRLKSSDEQAEAFKGQIETNEVDDAVGVEWDQFRSVGLEDGAEQAFSIVNRAQIPASLAVEPAAQSATAGRSATVQIVASDTSGVPYASRPLVYTIEGANPKTGSVLTNGAGVAAISYVGTAAGTDTLHMFLDLAGTGTRAARDPSASARIDWAQPPPTANSGFRVQSIRARRDGTVLVALVPQQDGRARVRVTVPTATIAAHGDSTAVAAKGCKKPLVGIRGACRPRTSLSGLMSAGGKAGLPLKLTVPPSSRVRKALARGRRVQLTATLTYRSTLAASTVARTYRFNVKGARKDRGAHKRPARVHHSARN